VRRLLVLLAVACGTWLAAPAAQQGATYRGTTDLVSIYATVTDARGRLVPDLTKDDFVVTDNGKRQTISLFNNDIQPFSVVVMLDCSGSMAGHADLVRDGTAEFIKRLMPEDRARIGSFSKEIRITPAGFTSDQAELLHILQVDLQGTGPSPIWTAVDRSITALLKETGRRVVLIFTDGYNAPGPGQVVWDVKDMMHRARFDEIMVYAIGFPGDVSSGWPGMGRGRGVIRLGPPAGGGSNTASPAPVLKDLAEETGGGYFEIELQGNLGATFARVADELHRQYWLGFKPAKLDEKTHQLQVTVRRPDVKVQARKNYIAGSAEKH
jgi:VWFA-related protein